jgi:hypothetical protein
VPECGRRDWQSEVEGKKQNDTFMRAHRNVGRDLTEDEIRAEATSVKRRWAMRPVRRK